MYKIINDFEKWLASNEDIKMNLEINIKSFEEYSIEKDLFLYDEYIVKDKIIKSCVTLYFKRLEEYIRKYINEFSFSNYKNLKELSSKTNVETIIYFFDWVKEENILSIKSFVKKIKERKYDSKDLYNIIRYHDYLIRDTLENNNYEATLDFLVDFFDSVKMKIEELSIEKQDISDSIFENKESNKIKLDGKIIDEKDNIKANEYVIDKLYDDFKSAQMQTFSIKFIH
ncbi:hypothetical protein [Caldisalinibacter kiritimatiensis]|uniref:Uncharacterized protein n=1 Tax=Caldisalinibacter kiritimatiensis TaxID=1304284 RepID=R1AVB8_9FIRM|nr:hypothetical protein [Caldisalinibacter kiritimatiensis]EOD01148.1 hypothetical protein L21TH_0788 [Caldisalinibacter kiritimatiensis]